MRKSGQVSFDLSVYNSSVDTDRFHTMVRDMSTLSDLAEPTVFHTFMNKLACDGRLRRHYTQNIDCIERRLPNLWGKTVQLHGRIDQAMCQYCGWSGPLDSGRFCGADLPSCDRCEEIAIEREKLGKRRLGIGRLRPDVVLYGEENPKGITIGTTAEQDVRKGPDVVLVVGTSLKVIGARRLVVELCRSAKARAGLTVWIGKDEPPSNLRFPFDLLFHGDCDEVASLLSI